jgi:hypothetical protein
MSRDCFEEITWLPQLATVLAELCSRMMKGL